MITDTFNYQLFSDTVVFTDTLKKGARMFLQNHVITKVCFLSQKELSYMKETEKRPLSARGRLDI